MMTFYEDFTMLIDGVRASGRADFGVLNPATEQPIGRAPDASEDELDRAVVAARREEQFGPVLPLLEFDTIDEAVRRANASEFGLGGSVWSGDEAKACTIARRIASGTVWVNETQYRTPLAAFGGMR